MTREDDQLIEALRDLVRSHAHEGEGACIIGQAINYDATNATIDVKIDDELTYPNVRLRSVIDGGNGIVIQPADSSYVVAMRLGADNTYLVIAYSSIAGITFNDGSKGGLINIADLVTKLNNLENAFNDLVSKFNTHTHTVATTGTAVAQTGTAAPTTILETTTLTPTNQSDIEDTTIKH